MHGIDSALRTNSSLGADSTFELIPCNSNSGSVGNYSNMIPVPGKNGIVTPLVCPTAAMCGAAADGCIPKRRCHPRSYKFSTLQFSLVSDPVSEASSPRASCEGPFTHHGCGDWGSFADQD